jgi:hypothetical protein
MNGLATIAASFVLMTSWVSAVALVTMVLLTI